MNVAEAIVKRFPEAKYVSNNTELLIRCPFCGDSKKDKSDAHFYISIKENVPHFYHCFLCNTKGVLNRKLLRYMGIYDEEAIRDVSKRVELPFVPVKYRKVYIPKQRDRWELNKLYYIADRLGTKKFGKYLDKLNIVTSIRKLMVYNRLPIKSERQVDFLDRNYIGFLLEDKSAVLCRKISSYSYGNRWFRYNLFDSDCSTYAIANKIEGPVEPKIYLAEGVLDILSVYTNSDDKERSEGIYIAIGNRNYIGNIKNMIQRIPATSQEYHIFMDNDVDINYLAKHIINTFASLHVYLKVFIHRNAYPNEKDYGVPANRIVDKVYKVL